MKLEKYYRVFLFIVLFGVYAKAWPCAQKLAVIGRECEKLEDGLMGAWYFKFSHKGNNLVPIFLQKRDEYGRDVLVEKMIPFFSIINKNGHTETVRNIPKGYELSTLVQMSLSATYGDSWSAYPVQTMVVNKEKKFSEH